MLMYAQNNHVMPRDTPIHTYTLTHNHSTAEGSRTIIPVALFIGYGGRSSIGALLVLTEGLMPILLNYSRRVGFPTTLCTLSHGRSLSLCSDGWCQHMNVHRTYFWTLYTKANYPYFAAPAARGKHSLGSKIWRAGGGLFRAGSAGPVEHPHKAKCTHRAHLRHYPTQQPI